ncbi:hypothetical protein VE00_07882 [Pseudogymnoascus sp. WSF 3629]|nr:hypothetical protein VE00_07882 [Pseudogymnoascus sp. WSF 3629]
MTFQAQWLDGQGMYQVSLGLDEGRNLTPGSPEFVISLIDFCKELFDIRMSRQQYKGDIQPEILQLALDQITSLEQDAILLENAQRA